VENSNTKNPNPKGGDVALNKKIQRKEVRNGKEVESIGRNRGKPVTGV